MPTCISCKKNIGVVGAFLSFNKKTQRCGNCDRIVNSALASFRKTFFTLCESGFLSQEKLQQLISESHQLNLNWQEAVTFLRGDALRFLERYITFASADGIITDQEERYFYWVRDSLRIPQSLSQQLVSRLEHLKYVSNIRQGNLPVLTASTHLHSDEICHLEVPATYRKVNLRSYRLIQGRLLATNKKVHFLSTDGGWTIQWKNVMRVEYEPFGIYLELATKSGNGYYQVPDPLLTEATINTLVRMSKRQLLAPQLENQSRHIPQDVKTAVWQRDQGKCVECGSGSYLEFDHIIPFIKGGASTFKNIQLLCRQCNGKKGDRL